MSDDTEKKDEASVDPDFNPDPDTSDVVAPVADVQVESVGADEQHNSLADRLHCMEARLHTLEQHVGEHVSGLHKHIAKLYEHIRRIGL